jgi:hypothetical protein
MQSRLKTVETTRNPTPAACAMFHTESGREIQMPQQTVRRSKNWKFSHAAAAMGAFWERTRKNEARRVERIRQALPTGAGAVVARVPGTGTRGLLLN